MALTLAAAISATATAFRVSGTVPATVDIGYRFRLDDELLEVRSFERTDISILNGYATQNVRDMNAWVVARHLEDTVAATHLLGAAVLGSGDAWVAAASEALPEPWAGSGGEAGPHAPTHEDAGADEVRTRVTDTVEDVEASEIVVVFGASAGQPRWVRHRVLHTDIVEVTDGANDFFGTVLTFPARTVIAAGFIVNVEAFDDSGLVGGDPPSIENYDNEGTWELAFGTAGLDTVSAYDAHGLLTHPGLPAVNRRFPIWFGPSGGSVIFNCGSPDFNDDGTTGIVDVWLVEALLP